MRKLTPAKLRILIIAVAMLVSVIGACGLGIRIDPDGMSLHWDWPDNITLPDLQKNFQPDSPPSTPLAPTG